MKISLLKTALAFIVLGTNMAHSMIFKLNTRRIAPYVMQAYFFSTPWGTSSANQPTAKHITIGKHTVIDPYSDAEKAQMTNLVKPLVMPEGYTEDAAELLVMDLSGKEKFIPYFTSEDEPDNRYFKELAKKNLPPLMLSLEFPFSPSIIKVYENTVPHRTGLSKPEVQDCIHYLTACSNLYVHDARTDKKINNANFKAFMIHLFHKNLMTHHKYRTSKTKEALYGTFMKFHDPLLFGSTNDPFAFHIRQAVTLLFITVNYNTYRPSSPIEDEEKYPRTCSW